MNKYEILQCVMNDKPFWFDNHSWKAVEGGDFTTCWDCNADSECNESVVELCDEIERFWGGHWILQLLA